MALRLVDVVKDTVRIRVARRVDGQWIHADDLILFFRETAKAARSQGSDVTGVALTAVADEIESLKKDAA